MGAGVGGWLGCPRRAHRRAGDGGGGGWRWADGNCKSESASTGWNRGVLGPLGGVSGHPSSAPPPQPFCDRGILSIRTARCMNTIMAMQAANKESSLYCAGAAATCACGGGAARGGRRESTEPATGQPPLSPQAPSRLPRQLHGPPADVNSVAATRVVAAVALTAAAYGAAHCTRPPPPPAGGDVLHGPYPPPSASSHSSVLRVCVSAWCCTFSSSSFCHSIRGVVVFPCCWCRNAL